MPSPHGEDNLKYGWLAKAKLEEERARLRKFEEDKAKKEEKLKKGPPWSGEAWRAARAASLAGVVEPERRFPVIINSLMTPEKLQEVADLPSLPEVKRTTLTSVLEEIAKENELIEVQCCDVNWKQLVRVRNNFEGKKVLIWFQGKQRFAWEAQSVRIGEWKV